MIHLTQPAVNSLQQKKWIFFVSPAAPARAQKQNRPRRFAKTAGRQSNGKRGFQIPHAPRIPGGGAAAETGEEAEKMPMAAFARDGAGAFMAGAFLTVRFLTAAGGEARLPRAG